MNDDPEPIHLDPRKFLIDGAADGNAEWMFTALHQPPTFPFTINVGGATVTLHGDGKWEGDIVAVKRAVAEMKGCQGTGAVLMWLVLRQLIRDDERFW